MEMDFAAFTLWALFRQGRKHPGHPTLKESERSAGTIAQQ